MISRARTCDQAGFIASLILIADILAMSWYVFVALVVVLASGAAILIALWLERR
jgi:hypothetical protein